MKITALKADWKKFNADALACFQPEDKKWLESSLEYYGKNTPIYNTAKEMIATGDMAGKKGEQIVLYPTTGEATVKRVILIGYGKQDEMTLEKVRRIAAQAAKKAVSLKSKSLCLYLPRIGRKNGEQIAAAATEGIMLGLYKFDKFFKKNGDEPEQTKLENVTYL